MQSMNEEFVFSLVFSVLSLLLLFGTSRTVSLGVFLLTLCCSLAVTNLMCPTLVQTLRDTNTQNSKVSSLVDTLQQTWHYLRSSMLG
jgi:hypothetical protein